MSEVLSRHHRLAAIAYRIAKDLSRTSQERPARHSVCAIIARKNKVLAIGINSYRTHPKSKTRESMTHAELSAINACDKDDLDGADMIVVRVRRTGMPGLSKPCASCDELIKSSGIKRVIWSVSTDQPYNFVTQE